MVWGGASESLDRSTILHSDKYETKNQCACRSTREIRGRGYGFMQCARGKAGIGGGVVRRKGVRQLAWFRRKADIATAREWAAPPARQLQPLDDRMIEATANKAEEVLLAAG